MTDRIEIKNITDEFKTTCPYCGVGCGIVQQISNNKIVSVKGDTTHPANYGRLCVKGSSLAETTHEQGRLLFPTIHGEQVSWLEATSHVANEFNKIIAEHGPDSVAFYLSGQLLTEDYYLANKLMKGFIGSGNVDTNSRLCMASASTAHKRAFGEDIVAGNYQDLEQADVIFIVGSNTAYAHPIVYQRIAAAKEQNPDLKVIVIDPRRTATCDLADIHLAIKPSSDAYFFNALLIYLVQNCGLDQGFIDQHTNGFSAALQMAQSQIGDWQNIAKICDVPLADISQSFELFLNNQKTVTLFSQGINQSSSGVDKGNAIINVHLAAGKVGKPGAGAFSITGQPNAMGGREVGGLANTLVAHMEFVPSDLDKVTRFWQTDSLAKNPGLKAVDMFQALDKGIIKAIWIMATNPVVSMPDANFVKQALEKCDLVVVSDCFQHSDTVKTANVLLPTTTWGEKIGMVTNSERRISLQHGRLTPPGQAKNDWQIICDVAAKMGYQEAFDFTHVSDVFKEHAALSGFENQGSRAFDISNLASMTKEEYLSFSPTQWPINEQYPNGRERFFDDRHFYTSDHKAKFIAILAQMSKLAPSDKQFILNTGRERDQWHTMTRTGQAEKLMVHTEQPYIQMNPKDAQQYGIMANQIAELSNRGSKFIAPVKVSNDVKQGEVFVPIHWNNQFSSAAIASALVNPIVDPLCGQPEFKHTPVNLKSLSFSLKGYLLVLQPLLADSYEDIVSSLVANNSYWSKANLNNGIKLYFEQNAQLDAVAERAKEQFSEITDWVEMLDKDEQGTNQIRLLGYLNDQLVVALILTIDMRVELNSQLLSSKLGELIDMEDKLSRFKLLAATAAQGEDKGKIICSCYQVGEKQIKQAIIVQGISSVEGLGKLLKCGSNCGSCKPELSGIISSCKS